MLSFEKAGHVFESDKTYVVTFQTFMRDGNQFITGNGSFVSGYLQSTDEIVEVKEW